MEEVTHGSNNLNNFQKWKNKVITPMSHETLHMVEFPSQRLFTTNVINAWSFITNLRKVPALHTIG